MTKTDTRDVEATLGQIRELATAGADIVRVAVPDEQAARALRHIVEGCPLPLVADIHFDHKLAILAVESGVHGLRLNPGNIGGASRVREVVAAARARCIPIRIGVNSGSLERDLLDQYGSAVPEALVESALRHVGILEAAGYGEIKISVKASDVARTVRAYRLLASKTDYPLHLGVTEAGTFAAGAVRSSVALGILLGEGIGDTIRVSLTDSPAQEVRVGLEILRSLGLRAGRGASVVSCPTCGRAQMDVAAVAQAVEAALEERYRANPQVSRPLVAIMGCVVNGPGEAREADIAAAGGRGKAALYLRGQHVATVPERELVASIMKLVEQWRPAASNPAGPAP